MAKHIWSPAELTTLGYQRLEPWSYTMGAAELAAKDLVHRGVEVQIAALDKSLADEPLFALFVKQPDVSRSDRTSRS